MMDEEKTRLRQTIAQLTDATLREHMLRALDQHLQHASEQEQDEPDPASDPICHTLQRAHVKVYRPRDALLLAVHLVFLESGFALANEVATSDEENKIPSQWDQHAAEGLFNCKYCHPHNLSLTFKLQALFVGSRLVVYVSHQHQTANSNLDVDSTQFLNQLTSSPAAAESCLKNLGRLREKMTVFVKSFAPEAPKRVIVSAGHETSRRDEEEETRRSPSQIPPVGRPDAFPSGLVGDRRGGADDPGTLVGPDHPVFGRRYDPSAGPVPGARFDPFGPPGFGPPPPRGPAPRIPFGDPNPDHLRMPRDDDDFDGGMGMGMRVPLGRRSGFGGDGRSGFPF